jgi:hypothetical protein
MTQSPSHRATVSVLCHALELVLVTSNVLIHIPSLSKAISTSFSVLRLPHTVIHVSPIKLVLRLFRVRDSRRVNFFEEHHPSNDPYIRTLVSSTAPSTSDPIASSTSIISSITPTPSPQSLSSSTSVTPSPSSSSLSTPLTPPSGYSLHTLTSTYVTDIGGSPTTVSLYPIHLSLVHFNIPVCAHGSAARSPSIKRYVYVLIYLPGRHPHHYGLTNFYILPCVTAYQCHRRIGNRRSCCIHHCPNFLIHHAKARATPPVLGARTKQTIPIPGPLPFRGGDGPSASSKPALDLLGPRAIHESQLAQLECQLLALARLLSFPFTLGLFAHTITSLVPAPASAAPARFRIGLDISRKHLATTLCRLSADGSAHSCLTKRRPRPYH